MSVQSQVVITRPEANGRLGPLSAPSVDWSLGMKMLPGVLSMIAQDRVSQNSHNWPLKGSVPMKQPATEEFDLSNRDNLSDDPERIAGYRAVSLAEGLAKGSDAQVLWAWQWLSDHPDVTNRLGEWFRRRVDELRAMNRIK